MAENWQHSSEQRWKYLYFYCKRFVVVFFINTLSEVCDVAATFVCNLHLKPSWIWETYKSMKKVVQIFFFKYHIIQGPYCISICYEECVCVCKISSTKCYKNSSLRQFRVQVTNSEIITSVIKMPYVNYWFCYIFDFIKLFRQLATIIKYISA